MISIIFGLVIIGIGVLTLMGRSIGLGNLRSKYTESSIKLFLNKAGICEIVMGSGSVLEGIFEKGYPLVIGFILEIAGIVSLLYCYFTTLKKKI